MRMVPQTAEEAKVADGLKAECREVSIRCTVHHRSGGCGDVYFLSRGSVELCRTNEERIYKLSYT